MRRPAGFPLSSDSTAKKRNIGLDMLRAAAIVGVFIAHGVNLHVAGQDVLETLGSGVQLFFVLSGFLIGRIYFRDSVNGDLSFWQFWRSRWWRTLPPYFAGMLVYLAVGLLTALPPLHWYYCLFLQNYLGVTGYGVSWSLCVEEHFYLLLPIVGFAVNRIFGRKSFRYFLPLAFVAPTVLRVVTLLVMKPLPPQWFWYTHLHCEALIAGVYLAYLFVDDRLRFDRLRRPARWVAWTVPVTMALVTFWLPRPVMAEMFITTLFAIGYSAWLLCFYRLQWEPASATGRLLRSGVQGIALCSYSLYLTHTTFDVVMRNQLLAGMHRGPLKSLVVLSTTFILGLAFYFLVEKPTIVSRDYFLHRSRVGAPMEIATSR